MKSLSVVLAALYLRGAPRHVEVRRSGWPEVVKALRRAGCSYCEAAGVLRDAGVWAEALVLEEPGLLAWVEERFDAGEVLTAADAGYPWRWLRVLGAGAPPALWVRGEVPALPSVSIVGSRTVSPRVARFCSAVAREAVELGFAVVSGRAEGCDRAAGQGAGDALVEIVPYGLGQLRGRVRGCVLSVCAPDEPFSSATAMERNALIYAFSSHTVIGAARFKEGGTWHGAVPAARNRLSALVLRESDDLAMRALAGLGGVWLDSPAGLARALKSSGAQAELFESAV